MKKCWECNTTKSLTEFYKNKSKKDGLTTECKFCITVRRKLNREKHVDYMKNYNPQYYLKNRDTVLSQTIAYAKNNRGKKNAIAMRYKTNKLQRTPKWIKDVFVKEIEVFYKRTQLIKIFTGEVWQVDHIIPLQGKKVSGLHVPWNLQLLPAVENQVKGNKFTPQ
jgi:5-methylcytosine-specific restriction endonuclease McrA